MPADHVRVDSTDSDEMQRAGAHVVLSLDENGFPSVRVSATKGTYITVFMDTDEIYSRYPDPEDLVEIQRVAVEAEAAKDMETKLSEALEKRVTGTEDSTELAHIVIEEMDKIQAVDFVAQNTTVKE